MAEKGHNGIEVSAFPGRVATWKGNLLIFGLLIVLVLAYFYRQVQQAHQTFLGHVQLNSGIIAGVIKRNADSAVLSQEVIGEIIRTFLSGNARFVAYLDGIEPFSANELTAYAKEAGLAGIRITRAGGNLTEGPVDWLPEINMHCREKMPLLRHLPDSHLYCLAFKPSASTGCITVGIAADRFEALQEQIGLSRLLETMSGQSGIEYIRIDTGDDALGEPPAPKTVRWIDVPDGRIAETRLPIGNNQLVLALDARRFHTRIQSLWREFFVFSATLAFLGVLLSWLLFRLQRAHLKQAQQYERELAQQREDATLGRAAASITHEIGNPLNAISMGLQRLEMEAGGIEPEHRELIDTMRKAVSRTSGIINGIRRYAKPLSPKKQPVDLCRLAAHILALYRQPCEAQGIEISLSADTDVTVSGDAPLLEEMTENLVKNAAEAQPSGGFLSLTVSRKGRQGVLCVENGGFDPSIENVKTILAPYFTTKTRGTGLGLSIAQRIVAVHGGTLQLGRPEPGRLRVTVLLPGADTDKKLKGDHENSGRR